MLTLPYGVAPQISFFIHELAMYILYALCLVHAIRRGGVFVSYLWGGALFGLILEYVNVNAGINYSYGQFWVMLGPTPEFGQIPQNIPLNIGLGWGIIIYTARLYSDRLAMPVWGRAAVDALLALNIDLSMDVVAYRLNMWHWGWEFIYPDLNPLELEFFGVPYANFFGWMFVVFFYSLFGRLLLERADRQSSVRGAWFAGATAGAILLAQVILFTSITILPSAMVQLFGDFFRLNFGPFAVLSIITIGILLALIITGAKKRSHIKTTSQATDALSQALIWVVPVYFHLYFLGWMIIQKYYLEDRWLIIMAIINMGVGLGAHIWSHRQQLHAPKFSLSKHSP